LTPSPFDLILLVLFIVVVIKVTLTGFITEFFSKAAVIIGTVGAILFYRKLAPYIVRFIGSDGFPELIAFLVIFLLLYLVVKLIQQGAGSVFEGETMSNLDRALGFFLGIAEGLLLTIVILIILRSQTWFDLTGVTHGSLVITYAEPFLSKSHLVLGKDMLPELFR